MDAKKCDRCGAFYVPSIEPKYKVQTRHNKNGGWHMGNTKSFDLCYNCRIELEDWMEEKWEDQNEPQASEESREQVLDDEEG